jgi:hypothetical protein
VDVCFDERLSQRNVACGDIVATLGEETTSEHGDAKTRGRAVTRLESHADRES